MKTGFVESRHGFQVRRLPGWAWRITVGALSAVHEECMWKKKKREFGVSC